MKINLTDLLEMLDDRTSFYDEVLISGLSLIVNNKKNSRFNTFLQFKKSGTNLECKCCKLKPSHVQYTEQYGLRMMIDDFNHLTVDHIIPKSKGGKSSPDNYQILCWICNHKKGNKL